MIYFDESRAWCLDYGTIATFCSDRDASQSEKGSASSQPANEDQEGMKVKIQTGNSETVVPCKSTDTIAEVLFSRCLI